MIDLRRGLPEIALAAASLLIFFGLSEAGLRLAGYGPEPPLPGPMYVRSATRGYDLKPGYLGEAERSPYLVHPPIAINQLGMRGPEVSAIKPDGVFRILCLGDSYMFGWGLRAQEALPARLEALLEPGATGGRRAQALNASVPAYGSAQELDRLREKGLPLEPDLVVLGFVLNDALPGGDRRPSLNIPLKNVLRHSAVYRFLGRLYQQGLMVAVAEAATPRQKLDDILAYERANTEILESGRPDAESARAETVDRIVEMSIECQRRGIPFLVVIFPNRYQVEDPAYTRARFNETLSLELAAAGIDAVDLFPAFKEASVHERLFLPDTHPNAAGHDLAARAVARHLLRKGKPGRAAGGAR